MIYYIIWVHINIQCQNKLRIIHLTKYLIYLDDYQYVIYYNLIKTNLMFCRRGMIKCAFFIFIVLRTVLFYNLPKCVNILFWVQ